MEDSFTIPQDFFPGQHSPALKEKTAIHVYLTHQSSVKAKVILNTNMFSFLLEGEKTVHRTGSVLTLKPIGGDAGEGQFLLAAGSNCLMTEKLSKGGRYSSLLFFFTDCALQDFFVKYHSLIDRVRGTRGTGISGSGKEPVVLFQGDLFIRHYLHSLQLMMESAPLPPEMQAVKLEELLLYLVENHPQALFSFRPAEQADRGDLQLKAAVENNIYTGITLEELAFLCNTSLSTFKRRFARLYGCTPNKWILQKRMELAAKLLLHYHDKPSEIYQKVGYENHSSFTQSFKQVYGVTPSEYQAGEGKEIERLPTAI